jgi:hypothetical protein
MFNADELEGLAVALRVAVKALPPNHLIQRWLPTLQSRVATEQAMSRKRPDLLSDRSDLSQGTWVDTTDAAKRLQLVGPRHAQRLAKKGALKAEKRSGVWFIELDSIHQYAATRKEAA